MADRGMADPLIIAGREFRSRLIVGTGKYKSFQETARALEASDAEMVTVAVRRVNLDRSKESLLDYIDPKRYFLLPNTAGCYTADEAIRAARLGREVGLSDWVKLEVIGDQATLYPDIQATLEATRILVKEGFTVLPYTSDDVVFAKRLLDAGASAVMPLGAPIGSGLGIQNVANIRILREVITGVPLILDAGVGTASDATIAMELGADAVLMNTGIAGAEDPVLMAEAMKHAVIAVRQAITACFIASAISTGSSAPAIPVFISTASAPSSIAMVASDAVPTPASKISGTPVIISRRMRMFAAFCIPSPLPIGAPRGITALAPASRSRFANTTSSDV